MARLAEGLAQLRSQANQLAPRRRKVSDGWIGDKYHRGRTSDHNPDRNGVVHAIDLTHDPSNGLDMNKVMAALVASVDPRISYLIWNKKIWNPSRSMQWRNYTGKNPHDKHGHISIKSARRDDKSPWRISDSTAPITHPEPLAANPYVGKPLLKEGSTKKEAVRELQTLLNALGAKPKLKVDGDFGPRTYNAVTEFQKSRGIKDDGEVGPYTWEQIALAKKERERRAKRKSQTKRKSKSQAKPSAAKKVRKKKTAKKKRGIDKKQFLDRVAVRLYAGQLPAAPRRTLEQILDYWQKNYPKGDLRWLAYALGTAHHETDRTFGPIREYGRGRGKSYSPYYGRGLVQLTWKDNYAKMERRIGLPGLARNPDLALEVKYAIPILFVGMEEGIFTAKKFSDYFNKTTSDWVQARNIVNKMDKAHLIASYAQNYYGALTP